MWLWDNDGEGFSATENQLFGDECFDRFLKLFVCQIILRKRHFFALLNGFTALLCLRSPERRLRHSILSLFFRFASSIDFCRRRRIILHYISNRNRFLLRFGCHVIFTRHRRNWIWNRFCFSADHLFVVVNGGLFRDISNVGRTGAILTGSDEHVVDIRLSSAVATAGEDGGFGGEKGDDDGVTEDEDEERRGDDASETTEKLAGDTSGERKGGEDPTEQEKSEADLCCAEEETNALETMQRLGFLCFHVGERDRIHFSRSDREMWEDWEKVVRRRRRKWTHASPQASLFIDFFPPFFVFFQIIVLGV